jgi:alpha-beta hydrolase superfamily lysophospholipase
MQLSKKRFRISTYLFYIFFTSIFIGFIGLHFIAPKLILGPHIHPGVNNSHKLGLQTKSVSIAIEDNQSLKGFWVNSEQDTTYGIMILVHGIGGNKESFLGLSKRLAKLGVASVLFDNRAHGSSGGKYCTYGFKEKEDIEKIIDFIHYKNPSLKVGIWGNSLGGAIALQSLEVESRISFGLIESTFTDLSQIVFDYKKRILQGFGIRALSDYVLRRAGKIAGFDPSLVKPLESVKRINQPVLIAHGNSDDNIHFKYGKQLHNALGSDDKIFIEVDNGEHAGLFVTGGQKYVDQTMSFIARQLDFEFK